MMNAIISFIKGVFYGIVFLCIAMVLIAMAASFYELKNMHKVSFVVESVDRNIGRDGGVYSYIHTKSGNIYEVNHTDKTVGYDYDLLVIGMTKGAKFDCIVQTYYGQDVPNDFVPTIIRCEYKGLEP